MPTYEYKCDSCGHRFERLQSITARPIRKCPKCGRPALRRLIGTGAAVLFKGSGFYATDYRSESYKDAAKKEKPEKEKGRESKQATGQSKKSQYEAKPEKKTEDKKKSS